MRELYSTPYFLVIVDHSLDRRRAVLEGFRKANASKSAAQTTQNPASAVSREISGIRCCNIIAPRSNDQAQTPCASLHLAICGSNRLWKCQAS